MYCPMIYKINIRYFWNLLLQLQIVRTMLVSTSLLDRLDIQLRQEKYKQTMFPSDLLVYKISYIFSEL